MITHYLRIFLVLAILNNMLIAYEKNEQLNTNNKSFSEFVSCDGINFILNGKHFFYAGTNTYYLMVFAAEHSLRSQVDEVLEETALMGLKVIRTWAFNDGADQWNALQTSPGNYQENVFQGLDYVLAKADSLGLRVILPLVNNWDDYGGMNQYVNWSNTANSHNDFYTDSNTKQWYKNHVATVLNRVNTISGKKYMDDPVIFAWELANEPRADGDLSGDILNDWIIEMSDYIKSIDSNHIVTTGIEGFYNEDGTSDWKRNGSTGTDFIRNHQVSNIDFATIHIWPDHWNMNYEQTINWIQEHIDDSHNIISKPIIIEEFGKQRDEGGSITIRNQFYQGIYNTIYNNRIGGSNFWILYHDSYTDYDGFGVYYPADTSTIEIITNEAEKMNTLTETKIENFDSSENGVTPHSKCIVYNHPNPFNQATTISYHIPVDGHIKLQIYNMQGQLVRTLFKGFQTSGWYFFKWNGRNENGSDLVSGIYISFLEISNFRVSKKILMLK